MGEYQQVGFPRSFVAAISALGSPSLRAVLPELLEVSCDIKILITTAFSRHIDSNRALKSSGRWRFSFGGGVRADLHADIIT